MGPKPKPRAAEAAAEAGATPPVTAPAIPTGAGLEVAHLVVKFGGVLAVDDVSLRAPVGAITGLIGPNGAGKTTTFNACSGLLRPTKGRVLLHDHDVTRASTAKRARLGLGRTFQRVQLFESLSVRTNIELARSARSREPIRCVTSSRVAVTHASSATRPRKRSASPASRTTSTPR